MSASRLYFAQHGIALSKAEDPERPLSATGIEQTRSVAQQLHTAGISISQIFHSGKLRAEQTASIFASILNPSAVSAIDYLLPNDDATLLAANLTSDDALYIGHLPHLEKLVSYLVTGETHPGIITFHNSATACLEKTDSHYSVQWYLAPELLNH